MNGFINLYKPAQFTSNDALNIVRRHFRGDKIGHGGTLDPDATGVLPVCVGKATRLQAKMMAGTKGYRAEIVFGKTSLSLDCSGEVIVTDKSFVPDKKRLFKVLAGFKGKGLQVPPAVSALKQHGVPLYKLARKGEEVNPESREIEIFDIGLEDMYCREGFYYIRIDVECSKGTYIRSLARDIGNALGTDAIISSLERTKSGSFRAENAITLKELEERAALGDYGFVIPMEEAVADMEKYIIDEGSCWKAVVNGNGFSCKEAQEGKDYALLDIFGNLMSLAHGTAGGLKPDVLLWGEQQRKKHLPRVVPMAEFTAETPCALAIGNFDGVHLGHAFLLENCIRRGRQRKLETRVLTFNPHTRSVADRDFKALSSIRDRNGLLLKYAVEDVIEADFTGEFPQLAAGDFIKNIIRDKLKASLVYVGEDFRFGRGGEGSASFLKEQCLEYGIEVAVIPRMKYKKEEISSTAVRRYLAAGNIRQACNMLGYSYYFKGEVVHGNALGRTFNFPTANIIPPGDIVLPAPGSYVCSARYGGKDHPAVCCIGTRPTVDKSNVTVVEIHILDDNPDLYGRELKASLLKFIRPQQIFKGIDELKEAIASDAKTAAEFFAE